MMGQLRCKMDPREFGRMGGLARVAATTPEQRQETSRKGGFARAKALSEKARRAIGRKGGKARAKVLTPEQRSAIGFMGARALNPNCQPKKPYQPLTAPDALLRKVVHLRSRGWTHTQVAASLGLTRNRVVCLFRLAFLKGMWEG